MINNLRRTQGGGCSLSAPLDAPLCVIEVEVIKANEKLNDLVRVLEPCTFDVSKSKNERSESKKLGISSGEDGSYVCKIFEKIKLYIQ